MSYSISNTIPNHYLLLLQPSAAVAANMVQLKKDFAAQFAAPDAIKSKAQITLVSFSQSNAAEHRIVKLLTTISQAQPFIKIAIENFGSFPAHTIYANITTKIAIQELVRNIRTKMQAMLKYDKDHKAHFILEPHIIIAKRLQPWQYEQAWLQYSNTPYKAAFVATSMLLLKKNDTAQKYQLVKEFAFGNKPIVIQQTNLFT